MTVPSGIGDHQGLLERQGPGEVDDCFRDRGADHATHRHDVVRVQRRGVNVKQPCPAAPRVAVHRDVDPAQTDVPHREAVQGGRRDMTDDRTVSHLCQSCPDGERVASEVVGEARVVGRHVGAGTDDGHQTLPAQTP